MSWDAPELGEPSGYLLTISEVGQQRMTTVHTADRSVRIPPGVLEDGELYFLVVVAKQHKGASSSRPL